MGGFLLKLQHFKKVKLIFGHPVPKTSIMPGLDYAKKSHKRQLRSTAEVITSLDNRSWSDAYSARCIILRCDWSCTWHACGTYAYYPHVYAFIEPNCVA